MTATERAPNESTIEAVRRLLGALSLPRILPDDEVPTRVLLYDSREVSLTAGPLHRDRNGQPIGGTAREAMTRVTALREADGGELYAHVLIGGDTHIRVHTDYVGVDLGNGGELPLVWESLIIFGDGPPDIDLVWRYATEGAARSGHDYICRALRRAADARYDH